MTAADRDRDAAGRARNARPRDAAGRPLPRSAAGVDRVADDAPPLPPPAALAEAQRLLDAGRPFHAHEVLEAVWKAAPDEERALWRGLAQLAVGLTHVQRGNATGAAALLRRGATGLREYAGGRPYGVAVDELVEAAESAADRVARGAATIPSLTLVAAPDDHAERL